MPKYVLDSNIFIQSVNREYRFSFCSGFWDLLQDLYQNDVICSIKTVKRELTQRNDDLSDWVKNKLPNNFFHNELVAGYEYGRLMQWAYSNLQFSDNAKQVFADENRADAWLVAYAAKQGMTVVTHEVLEPYIKKAIKIPNAAQHLSVPCVHIYDFLEKVAKGNFERK
ncbi:DUF4411 family protein [Cardiobacterium valvarum]|uniref:PIN domain protein n=1 Tax=Cardiobacterium valvarum F0432 TaxID=797473 RepID=G9ZFQ9_9GAMM|nr:DUF4411 family protein [Cardiobacterium valvarum]EHM53812.1 PIN domain protein [Cardiobacterium valvarum F0432]